jgi:hypothetical protein
VPDGDLAGRRIDLGLTAYHSVVVVVPILFTAARRVRCGADRIGGMPQTPPAWGWASWRRGGGRTVPNPLYAAR